MSLIVAGTVAIDNVKTPTAFHEGLLGGSASYASLAASIFAKPVHLVGVIGHDFPKQHLDMLADRGVDVNVLECSTVRFPLDSLSRNTRYPFGVQQREQVRGVGG